MTPNNPLVSVIIAVYNCEKYLAEAIESVLAQTYQSIEIIVVDDGSTDDSAEVAKRFTPVVKYCYQPHSGVAVALNHGIQMITGHFIAFLDADDLWVADKLMRQMAVFEAHPELDAVFGHVKQFCSPELDETIKQKTKFSTEITPAYLKGTMLIKQDALLRIGLFDTHWRVGDFIDWYIRAMEQGIKSFMLPELLLKRRIHDTNTGIRERKSQIDYVRILKASLDRRRAASQLGHNS